MRLGQSYNPGTRGMQGIIGVKKASLFGKTPQTPNATASSGGNKTVGILRSSDQEMVGGVADQVHHLRMSGQNDQFIAAGGSGAGSFKLN